MILFSITHWYQTIKRARGKQHIRQILLIQEKSLKTRGLNISAGIVRSWGIWKRESDKNNHSHYLVLKKKCFLEIQSKEWNRNRRGKNTMWPREIKREMYKTAVFVTRRENTWYNSLIWYAFSIIFFSISWIVFYLFSRNLFQSVVCVFIECDIWVTWAWVTMIWLIA